MIKKQSFAHLPMPSLKFYHIQEFLDELCTKLKPSTVRGYRSVIATAMSYAHATEKISKNPSAALEEIEGSPEPIDPPSPSEIVQLLNFLREQIVQNPDDYVLRIMYMFEHIDCFTGMRIGEICALQWRDISETEKCITVSKTIMKNGEIQHSTKNNTTRKVYITEVDLKLLSSYKRFWKEICLTRGIVLKDDHFVFPRCRLSSRGANYFYPEQNSTHEAMRYRHYDVLKKAGLPRRRPHANRHAVSTYMQMETGASVKVVQDRLGHSNDSVTLNTYTHVPKKIHLEEAERSAEFFANLGYEALS